MKRIAVLMTCFNRVDTTLACLRRLFAQELPEGYSFDVWLVDDASPDKTGEKVEASYPQVNVVYGTGKLFWCKGMRLAWENAVSANDYDGYLWLNDDVMLFDDAIDGMVRDAESVADESILVGATLDDGGHVAYGMSGGSGKIVPKGYPYHGRGEMSGNFVYVPRSVFRRIGMIYGGYSHGYGDYDYGWLADRNGIARYLCSKAVGVCPQQPERYKHKLKDLSLVQRVRLLMDGKGFPVRDSFVYKYRNFGLVAAMLSVLHIVWIRVILKYEK